MEKKNNKIVFVGCVQEGKDFLKHIIQFGGNVCAILTFTDELAAKTSGAVSFENVAQKNQIPLYKVETTNSKSSIELLKSLNPDTLFVVGWTRLLSKEVLQIPKNGCIGLHASLLPRYRGRAPVNWAILNGDNKTGNTMMVLDEGVDTGDIIAQEHITISASDTCETLYEKVSMAGVKMLKHILPNLGHLLKYRQKQENGQATVMPKRTPEDGRVDWDRSGLELYNWVRALTKPYPGAFSYLGENKVFIWETRLAHHYSNSYRKTLNVPTGTIINFDDGIVVKAGNNELSSLNRLSTENGEILSWQEFVKLQKMKIMERFDF
jgi:methionyl-tRNA formyltransferase